jgi:hypothetical protein
MKALLAFLARGWLLIVRGPERGLIGDLGIRQPVARPLPPGQAARGPHLAAGRLIPAPPGERATRGLGRRIAVAPLVLRAGRGQPPGSPLGEPGSTPGPATARPNGSATSSARRCGVWCAAMTRHAFVLAAMVAMGCTQPMDRSVPQSDGGADAAEVADVAPSADSSPDLPMMVTSPVAPPDAAADLAADLSPAGPPDAPPGPPADAAPACQPACSSGARRCSGSGVQTCGPGPSGCLGWSAPAACPAPARALSTCAGEGACSAPACDSSALECLGSELRCDPSRWDFEGGTDGWELAPGSAVGTLAASKAQAHAGSGSLAISWRGDKVNSDVRVLHRICDPGFTGNLRGRLVTAWIRFEGGPLPSSCAVCEGSFLSLPSAYPDTALSRSPVPMDRSPSGDITLDERARVTPVVGQWQQLTGYFPVNEPGAGPDDLWTKSPVSLMVTCSLATSDCTTPFNADTLVWNGTVYLDEIVIN